MLNNKIIIILLLSLFIISIFIIGIISYHNEDKLTKIREPLISKLVGDTLQSHESSTVRLMKRLKRNNTN